MKLLQLFTPSTSLSCSSSLIVAVNWIRSRFMHIHILHHRIVYIRLHMDYHRSIIMETPQRTNLAHYTIVLSIVLIITIILILYCNLYRNENTPTSPPHVQSQIYPRQPNHYHHHYLLGQFFASNRPISSIVIDLNNEREVLDAISFNDLCACVPSRPKSKSKRFQSIGRTMA